MPSGPSALPRFAHDEGVLGGLEIAKTGAGVMVVGWAKRAM